MPRNLVPGAEANLHQPAADDVGRPRVTTFTGFGSLMAAFSTLRLQVGVNPRVAIQNPGDSGDAHPLRWADRQADG